VADPDRDALIARINQAMVLGVPFNLALGLRVEDASIDGVAAMRLPYRADLVGNPETGVLHGGMVTSLIDACCGLAVFLKTGGAVRVATLDLRIDYLRTARPPEDVVARAECYKLTKHVAFVRALAHDANAADPIAAASGTFVIFDRGKAHG
jgi:uncharacterized protein (TIGR00369 family)